MQYSQARNCQAQHFRLTPTSWMFPLKACFCWAWIPLSLTPYLSWCLKFMHCKEILTQLLTSYWMCWPPLLHDHVCLPQQPSTYLTRHPHSQNFQVFTPCPSPLSQNFTLHNGTVEWYFLDHHLIIEHVIHNNYIIECIFNHCQIIHILFGWINHGLWHVDLCDHLVIQYNNLKYQLLWHYQLNCHIKLHQFNHELYHHINPV